jgi:hypothetical protein
MARGALLQRPPSKPSSPSLFHYKMGYGSTLLHTGTGGSFAGTSARFGSENTLTSDLGSTFTADFVQNDLLSSKYETLAISKGHLPGYTGAVQTPLS